MKIFFLFFLSSSLSLVSFALPLPLTAQPKKESIKLFIRLIREDSRELDNMALRQQMLGMTLSRLWANKLARSLEPKISCFLDETFDSLIVHMSKEEARRRSYVAERLGLSFSDAEYQQIESILRMTKEEREKLFRNAVSPMIRRWRSHFKAPMSQRGEWKNIEENVLIDHFPAYADYIEWVSEPGAAASRFTMLRHPDGNQYAFLFDPSPHLSVDHLPTHLQIRGMGEASQVAEIVYFQSKYGFKGTADSFFLLSPLSGEHRFVTLSFIRKNSPSIVKIPFGPEKTLVPNAIIDLTSGRVYSGWHGWRGWLKVMQRPMTDLFHEELAQLESPLSQLLLTTLRDLRSQGVHDIDAFLEKELTLIRNGVFRYRLARFNFEAGSFENGSPVLTFVIEMNNLSRPKVLSFDISP